ncbi:MAG: methylenetetrahydrofolate reductase [NAD(P)H] [Chloroflexi bacterium]|nr:methylenetetrahydrofolate reductase [NAD(P)H] [Chloroflexota bacterium]
MIDTMTIPAPFQVSFEFFPPRSPEMDATLWRTIKRLEPLEPRFVSVTCGAGGGAREFTAEIVRRIMSETTLVPAAHITCVGAAREELDDLADVYWELGVRRIVALRGDPPVGEARYTPHPDGYYGAFDLVSGLRRRHDFDITVAAYPETHPESPSVEADIENLKRKIDAGATRAITQFFFDNERYLRFVEQARKAGITAPIVPGIMPVMNFAQIARFAATAGASVPQSLVRAFHGLERDQETRRLVAAYIAGEQCRQLAAEGVNEFHFYTMNHAELTYALCHILGLRPASEFAGASRGNVL